MQASSRLSDDASVHHSDTTGEPNGVKLASGSEDEGGSSSEETSENTNLREFAPAKPANGGIDTEHGEQAPTSLQIAANNFVNDLRRRNPPPSSTATTSHPAAADITKSTENLSAQKSTLFAGASTAESNKDGIKDSEILMDRARSDQESLTNSLLQMAQRLKQQSHTFADTLSSSKGVVDAAVEGLERSATGLTTAEQRMGKLRRMTEGKGWWGRMMVYAWIAALWLGLVLLVFVFPKLRR